MNPGLTYREAAVVGASPVGLVVLLYEQVIEDLRRALTAQKNGAIEARTREINHAILVLGHLEATLNQEQGGRVAENLQHFYRQLRAGLTEAQAQQSASLLEKQISLLMQVRDGWLEVERQLRPTAAPTGAQSSTDWSA